MKKLITAFFAILIIGAGMGLGSASVAAKDFSAPDAFNVSIDMDAKDTVLMGTLVNDMNLKKGLNYRLVANSGPTHGTLVLEGSGKFTYTATDSAVPDSFMFQICKANNCSDPKTAAINIINHDFNIPLTLRNFEGTAYWGAELVKLIHNDFSFDSPVTLTIDNKTFSSDSLINYANNHVNDTDPLIEFHLYVVGDEPRIEFFHWGTNPDLDDVAIVDYSATDGLNEVSGQITVYFDDGL